MLILLPFSPSKFSKGIYFKHHGHGVPFSQLPGVEQAFGWTIVLYTAFIKLLFFPLQQGQLKSTSMMQLLQPKVKEIQERYKEIQMVMASKLYVFCIILRMGQQSNTINPSDLRILSTLFNHEPNIAKQRKEGSGFPVFLVRLRQLENMCVMPIWMKICGRI